MEGKPPLTNFALVYLFWVLHWWGGFDVWANILVYGFLRGYRAESIRIDQDNDHAIVRIVIKLFDSTNSFTSDVESALKSIINNKKPNASKKKLQAFYKNLVRVLMVLCKYCSEKEVEFPRTTDTQDRRRPILEIWHRINADLFSLQSVIIQGRNAALVEFEASPTDVAKEIANNDSIIEDKKV